MLQGDASAFNLSFVCLASELLKLEPHPFGPTSVAAPEAGHHTMAVVVRDAKGNLAVLVHSANGAPTGIVVGGVPIPEAATVNKWALPAAHAVSWQSPSTRS